MGGRADRNGGQAGGDEGGDWRFLAKRQDEISGPGQ